MKHPPYPAYKPSGVEWLGDVPEHWDVKAIKWISPVKRGASPRPIENPIYFDDEGDYAWVRISDVTASVKYLFETEQKLSDLGSSLSVKLEPGKLFLSIAGSVGKACITKTHACIHDGFVYFPDLKPENNLFFYYLFEAGEAYKGLGKLGTQLNLNTDTIGSIRIGFPPLEEQQQIAAFLEAKTARIDDLIAKQERLLELLEEKRKTLISHAVTKGLDAGVEMKDSGVDWLGQIPQHWKINKFRHFSVIGNGSTPNKDEPRYWAYGDFPWMTSTVVNGDLVTEATELVTEVALKECHLPILEPGVVIVGITGQGKTRGMAAILGVEATINQHLAYIKTDQSRMSFMYCHKLFTALYDYLRYISDGGGSTKGALTCEQIAQLWIPVPPLEEQSRIVAFLDSETAKLDALSAKASAVIDLLREHRTSLISAAVTGKIDVRTKVEPTEVLV